MNKALHIGNVCKKTVVDKKVIHGKMGKLGVIWGIPVEEDLDNIKKNILGGIVTNVKLNKTVNGKRVASLSVLIDFQNEKLPERVKIGIHELLCQRICSTTS